jgi:CubicO group peptidase (beta-lactamase class C family)
MIVQRFVSYLSICSAMLQANAACQPEIAFVPPNYETDSLKGAFDAIKSTIDLAVAKGVFSTTSFSLQISSSNRDLFSLFRAADKSTAKGTKLIDGSSVYRIASNTKLFTALGILQLDAAGKLSLDHPVTRYISLLPTPSRIPWHKITIRALLSHLGGIPDNCESPLLPG